MAFKKDSSPLNNFILGLKAECLINESIRLQWDMKERVVFQLMKRYFGFKVTNICNISLSASKGII